MHKSFQWYAARCGVSVFLAICFCSPVWAADGPWTSDQANKWYLQQPWLVGSNFITSSAINELEMWQPDTFDLPAVDRELGWAQSLGMNTMRVFLHNLLWQQDSQGFLRRIDQFLEVADKHHIRITFVLLDSVWDPRPHLGKQPAPKPHVHNSGWVQAPGADLLKDESRWNTELKPYIIGVLSHFHDDKRVLMWDLMNEPDNRNDVYKATELPDKAARALKLLREEWKWARSVNPAQPLTSGVWKGNYSSDSSLSEMERFQLQNSDVITFHSYDPPDVMSRRIDSLRRYHRPIICTEYMARPLGSTFASILPLLKKEHVGAYNWGFVNGKSQTIYPWDSWEKSYSGEPAIWFHDIFRKDGAPYDARETELIRQLTGVDAVGR
ncbi:MAG TPA: cellulase family glycosylhydrolase [Terriglobales bacterium]|nr:cellulase family glycosylhydrolase [Terriglobales bacterium]